MFCSGVGKANLFYFNQDDLKIFSSKKFYSYFLVYICPHLVFAMVVLISLIRFFGG